MTTKEIDYSKLFNALNGTDPETLVPNVQSELKALIKKHKKSKNPELENVILRTAEQMQGKPCTGGGDARAKIYCYIATEAPKNSTLSQKATKIVTPILEQKLCQKPKIMSAQEILHSFIK